ncbi:MAG TPA: nucleotidyl transferase AbiEii/AbiGii toxin family protein [Planctomycetota bacterium]|nr:nucleotidyl transferase AbiEii/AbiGii toxin family protein [Planctomycetota bacterium]
MLSEILGRVARSLAAARLPYMVIGGQAVLVHGEPRLTRDIDITLGVSVDRLDDVLRAAAAAGLEPLVDPGPFASETLVLPCADRNSGVRVDLVFSESGYEREAIQRARTVRIAATDVRFVTPEDLIVHKLLAARPRDLEDVRSILARQPQLDRKLVERTLGALEEASEQPLLERWREVTRES